MPSRTIYFPQGTLEDVNQLVEEGEFDNPSEAVATLTDIGLSEFQE